MRQSSQLISSSARLGAARSNYRWRRRVILLVTAALTLAVLPSPDVVARPPQPRPPDASTQRTTGKAVADPEIVPADDPMGQPSRYEVASVDDVLVSNYSTGGDGVLTTSRIKATTDAAVSTISSSTSAADEHSKSSANPTVRQVRGHFDVPADEKAPPYESVITMQMSTVDGVPNFLVNTQDRTASSDPNNFVQFPVPGARLDNPFAVAAGDLDRAVSQPAERYVDETAIAFLGPDGRLAVQVIDFAQAAGRWTTTPATGTLPSLATTNGPGSVGLEIGDFDGDGGNEVAAVWQGSGNEFHLTVLDYATSDSGGNSTKPSLTVTVPDLALPTPTNGWTPLAAAGLNDTAVGDFDGTGRDDLALAFQV